MDGGTLFVFLLTTFVGGVVTGLAGFAMGLVVSGIWLHIMTPAEAAALIVSYGLLIQIYSLWRLRRSLDWRRLAPFLIGGLFGVPVGAWLLAYIPPDTVRIGVGILLIGYSSYSLSRPHFPPMDAAFPVETGVGFLNGILGGMTGLSGPIISMWCQLRGWSKDEQRAVFQPVILCAFALTFISFAVAGNLTRHVGELYLMGLPMQLVGVWAGFKLYGHLDDALFRKAILVLLLLSGLMLVIPWSVFG